MKVSKNQIIQIIKEEAAAYVWGVKSPGRVANIYSVDPAKQVIKEDHDNVTMARMSGPAGVNPAGDEDSEARAVVAQSLRDMQVPVPPPVEKMHALWYQLNLVLNRNHGLEDLKQIMQQISRDPDAAFPEEEEVPADTGLHHPQMGLRNHPQPGVYFEKKEK